MQSDSPPNTSSPLLAQLNDEQHRAVALPPEHALILAGAGSGKTRVLTTRIAWLLQTSQVSPGGILAVTFTNKAAKEMKLRLQSMLPVNVNAMWIGTFHGLCNRFLRAHFQLAGLPQTFQILDTQDQLSAIKRLCKQFNVDEDRFPPKQLQYFISGCKEDGQRPVDVTVRDDETRRKVELYQLYEEQCQREGVVDFGELMLRSYELLRDNAHVREHYRRRFRHILVDEFQDTNKLQYAWLKQLAGLPGEGGECAILAVGDDDQSIYAFRGARVGNMADFVREFQVQHQIKLEQNYRSFSNILDSANHLISHNKTRLGKTLRTDQGAGEPVRVVESPSDFAEAQWLVEELRQLVKQDGFERKEVALLYRSNAQSRVLETALFNAGFPYRVYGGLRFFERAEIKHALAYLRLMENPSDDTSFLRVVNFPPRGIGARSVEQLQDAARAAGCSLHDAVSATTGKAGANLAAFVAMVDVLREQTEGLTLREIIDLVLDKTGLVTHYRAEKEGADRVENLEELVNAAESFVTQEGFGRSAVALPQGLSQSPASQGLTAAGDGSPRFARDDGIGARDDGVGARDHGAGARDGTPDVTASEARQSMVGLGSEFGEDGVTMSPLAAFLTHASLEAGDNQAQAGEDAVQLMTVHASKGLEFDAVFITGLEEGLFPHENAMNDFDGLEEERRLMYVAITRARKRLYLSHSQTRMLHGQTRYNLKSRFLEELPEECLKWVTPKNGGFSNLGSAGGGGASTAGGGWPQTPAFNRHARPAWGQSSLSTETYKSPPVPVQKAEPEHGITAGKNVFHTKFGEGKVLAVEGVGADARAQVNFPRHGVKWLALSVAKLTVV
ncbi:UvrD-helicase domain-containing protein [Limnohabitans sp. Bal53]|uniref:UvrD-helicase domain-containing protein n=1 Tax=Limnohabitans sp. Bal53 TaxID=1977910 RepID=UPI000D3B6BB1|nr:UvrD-helicase domain-containing protein [Limnohabitans sp. Bal53]PUE40082.1 DNA helicase II [Limnohabitans sp. Bal53]